MSYRSICPIITKCYSPRRSWVIANQAQLVRWEIESKMTIKAAEDYEDIARRLKELEADRQIALTGSTLDSKVGEASTQFPYTIEDYVA